MKRFLVFGGIQGEARGGLEDLLGSYATFEDADEALVVWVDEKDLMVRAAHVELWWHIFDRDSGRVITASSPHLERRLQRKLVLQGGR